MRPFSTAAKLAGRGGPSAAMSEGLSALSRPGRVFYIAASSYPGGCKIEAGQDVVDTVLMLHDSTCGGHAVIGRDRARERALDAPSSDVLDI